MKKDEKGFTLMEAVTALAVLSLFSLIFLPVYQRSLEEQKTVDEERTALYLLEKEALTSIYHQPGVETGDTDGIYEWSRHSKQAGTNLCLQWEGGNGRFYKKCLFFLSSFKRHDTD
ncbi:type II secretion system protein [Salibacterium qingdaonense]|uniref:Competence protein ComGE n=1 Tax=Salibacterium qingdaonense TaxID=266892 RepID=A0A1I4JM51_9BACI|nr:prepilin-type N-terminal cleavage/methylation domain-containing protein [Salibacterium qingdaonense]SFL67685.1 competence protein ComGE [Salibacterium qingdaonense]